MPEHILSVLTKVLKIISFNIHIKYSNPFGHPFTIILDLLISSQWWLLSETKGVLLFQLTKINVLPSISMERLGAECNIFNKEKPGLEVKTFGDGVFLSRHCCRSHKFRTSWEKVSSS